MGDTESYSFKCDINGNYWCGDCNGPEYAEYQEEPRIGSDYRIKDGVVAFPDRPEECDECGNKKGRPVKHRPDDDQTYKGFEDYAGDEEGFWKCRNCGHKHSKKELAKTQLQRGEE